MNVSHNLIPENDSWIVSRLLCNVDLDKCVIAIKTKNFSYHWVF